jgi:hypothetical protein
MGVQCFLALGAQRLGRNNFSIAQVSVVDGPGLYDSALSPLLKRDRSHASEFVRQIRVDKIREEMVGKEGSISQKTGFNQFIYI